MSYPFYKAFMPWRIVFLTAFLWGLAALWGGVSMAAPQDPLFTIEGVSVDVTAANAVEAREKALLEAQVKAYTTLAERVLPPDAFARFSPPSAEEISFLVQDFEVTNEQLSRVRYKGVFTIRFRPNALKNQMAAKGQDMTAALQKPVLMIPYFAEGGRLLLWGDTNPWLGIWQQMPASRAGQARVSIPLGDAQDIAVLGDDDLYYYDPIKIQEMAQRYGADDVLFALAGWEGPSRRLSVDIYKHGFNGAQKIHSLIVERAVNEPDLTILSRASEAVIAILPTVSRDQADAQQQAGFDYNSAYYPPAAASDDQRGQTRTAANFNNNPMTFYSQAQQEKSAAQNFATLVRFQSVQEWVAMKMGIERTAGVQGVLVKTLRAREALVDIRFAGDLTQLRAALRGAGLVVAGQHGNPTAALEILSATAPRPMGTP